MRAALVAALALVPLPALVLVRQLPDDGVSLYLKLLVATIVILAPGAFVNRGLGGQLRAGDFAWGLAAVGAALAVTFALDGSVRTAVFVLAAVAVAALPLVVRRELRGGRVPRGYRGAALAGGLGIAFGIALWQVVGHVDGDQLFHLARVRKLLELDGLELSSANEFVDGDLHPGYAFPLWHGFLALVAFVAGVDPELVMLHLPSILVPTAFVLAYEAGRVVFGSAWLGLAAMAAQVALIGLAPPHAGAYPVLSGPGTAARQLLVPAVVALFFASLRRRSWLALATLAAATAALAIVHITYAVFVCIPLGGFLLARALLRGRDLGRGAAALAAVALPTGAITLALLPLANDTVSRTPGAEELDRGLEHYRTQLDVFSETSYRLAPEVFSRTGAISIAALVLIPAAALVARRRWAAFVLGGSLAVLAAMLVPELFVWLSDHSSLSQSRRAAGFLPFAFALVGGAAVVAGLVRWAVLPLALAAGTWLRWEYPGDFTVKLEGGGGPALVAWIALVAGLAALLLAVVARPGGVKRSGPLAAAAVALFLFPTAVRGFAEWTPSPERRPSPLTRGLVAALDERVATGAIVFSDLETSYRIAAAAPLYLAAAPPAHVADTVRNRPYERREDNLRFFATGDSRILRRYGAQWLVVDRQRFERLQRRLDALEPLYEDERYSLYRVR